MIKTDQQKMAAYKKALRKWQRSKPKSGNNYDLEAWLEEKPVKPGRLA